MLNKAGVISGRVIVYLFLGALCLISIIPFYLVIINSTHRSFDIVTRLNLWLGGSIAENYQTMQSHVNIWRGFYNSICIAIPFVMLTGYFGALTAFGFAKYRFRCKNFLFILVLVSMMLPSYLPSQLSIIGFYKLNLQLRLLNSYIPFILPGIANGAAVFFLRGMIEQGVPNSIMESARIEGCGELYIFNRIVLPCIMPGVATMGIFNFVSSWNYYIGPLILMADNQKYTMPVMIAMIRGLYQSNYGAMYLAIAISIMPIIVVYIFCSKYIINGVTAGADKG
jgi:multiple sugar transport system permease protein